MERENRINDAITYKELFLPSIGAAYFRKVDIRQKPGEHATLYLEAILDSDMEENDFHGINDTITLMYQDNGKESPLFYGIIDEISMEKDGDSYLLVIKAWDATRIMDTNRRCRAFQNPQMTVKQLTDEVMKTYPGADYKINVPDIEIGQLILQYEETDWEFLKRFFSRYHETLYPNPAFDAVRLQAGPSPVPENFYWDELPYELHQDFLDLNARKENGMGDLSCAQNTEYQIDSYDIAALGNQIQYKGTVWYIASLERNLERGLLINHYHLRQKEGMLVLSYFNPRITGISIDGLVKAVSRDRLQIEMEIDAGAGGVNNYWFPYSTVASSSDGSGWYCMPENGESVRVYFPDDDEKEAYAITNIKAHAPQAGGGSQGGAPDPMGNPNVRNIQTAQGNQVQFTEEGVVIAAGGGEGSILLKKSGEVIVNAAKDISISAGEAINIVAANEMTLKSQTSIKVASAAGADVEIKAGEINLHGMLINEN